MYCFVYISLIKFIYAHIYVLHDIWRFIFLSQNVLSRTITRISLAQLCTKGIAILQLIYLYKIHKGTFISYLLAAKGNPHSQEFVLVVYLSMLFGVIQYQYENGHLKL